MAITVIPAYRVIKRFLRDVEDLPRDALLDSLEAKVRTYVQHLLSGVQGSLGEVGRRAAITQLGDPDVLTLGLALEAMEEGGAKSLVEETFGRCAEILPRPDLATRVLLLPGDGQSRVFISQMKGVIGLSIGAQAMLLFLWPTEEWKIRLAYTVSHEYTHLVRNLLFPRGFVGGKLVYQKSQEPETLLDVMVAEGIADAFAMEMHPGTEPPWTRALSPEAEASLWPRVRRRLSVSDTTEIRRILFGDNDRIPIWTGYAIGYNIVRGYLEQRATARPAGLVGLSARAIFEASGYPMSLGPA